MKVKINPTRRHVRAEHGVVSSFPGDFFGYFGWPTVAQTQEGVLVVAASGLRNDHVCPFGRTVLCRSEDKGLTWTSPRVINDSPLDDRDAGLVSLGEEKLLLTWFSTDNRMSSGQRYQSMDDKEKVARWQEGFARITDDVASRCAGAWMRRSNDGGETWTAPKKILLTTPHGPIRLSTGVLLFVGKRFSRMEDFSRGEGPVAVMRSTDGGLEWEMVSTLPLARKTVDNQYHEAHVAELPDGRLVALIRIEDAEGYPLVEAGIESFSLVQSISEDRGHTWSTPEPLGFHGAPPHMFYHSSGVLVCTYGYRKGPYGQRAMLSRDWGESWECDLILRDDGPDSDLGYPSSVELADRSIFTVYYQKERADGQCSLLWTRWFLED